MTDSNSKGIKEQQPMSVGEVVEKLLTFDQTLPFYVSDLDTDWEIPVVPNPDFPGPSKEAFYQKDGRVIVRPQGY